MVCIFIVKNSRETMAARFCNRRFASRCSRNGMAQVSFLIWRENTTSAAAACERATKHPARHPARAAGVVLMNTLFWKILVTRVKRKVREFDCGGFLAFVTALGAKRWLKSGFRDWRERDANVATISGDCPICTRNAEGRAVRQ